ncbi:hypothetical protein EI94DRAFT_1697819 [Lactarius quietus]|nr:hypothetical protein EI94DRAFT_1697819 [Lactarius quietus]
MCLKYVVQRRSTFLNMMTYNTRDLPFSHKYSTQLTERLSIRELSSSIVGRQQQIWSWWQQPVETIHSKCSVHVPLSMALVPYCGDADTQHQNLTLEQQQIIHTREGDISTSIAHVQHSDDTQCLRLSIQQQEQEAENPELKTQHWGPMRMQHQEQEAIKRRSILDVLKEFVGILHRRKEVVKCCDSVEGVYHVVDMMLKEAWAVMCEGLRGVEMTSTGTGACEGMKLRWTIVSIHKSYNIQRYFLHHDKDALMEPQQIVHAVEPANPQHKGSNQQPTQAQLMTKSFEMCGHNQQASDSAREMVGPVCQGLAIQLAQGVIGAFGAIAKTLYQNTKLLESLLSHTIHAQNVGMAASQTPIPQDPESTKTSAMATGKKQGHEFRPAPMEAILRFKFTNEAEDGPSLDHFQECCKMPLKKRWQQLNKLRHTKKLHNETGLRSRRRQMMDLLVCGEKWDGRHAAWQGNNGIAVLGLPENCYNLEWLNSLKYYQTDKLDIQPPADLTFSEEEKQLAAQFIPLAKGDGDTPTNTEVVNTSGLESWLLYGRVEGY